MGDLLTYCLHYNTRDQRTIVKPLSKTQVILPPCELRKEVYHILVVKVKQKTLEGKYGSFFLCISNQQIQMNTMKEQLVRGVKKIIVKGMLLFFKQKSRTYISNVKKMDVLCG